MTQLDLHCSDCGLAVTEGSLCAACEQDRVMEQAQIGQTETSRAIYGEIS